MKKLIVVISAILVLFAFAAVTKNLAATLAISAGVRAVTGVKLNIKSVNIGVFKTLVDIKGLEMFNPAGFEDMLMANAPEIYVDYNLGDLLRKKAHFEEVRFDLEELVVVKNKEGELNLDSLKVVKKKEDDAGISKKKKAPALQIDVLELKVGKVIYKDYSAGGPPKIREYNVNINARYKNIDDPRAFGRLVLFNALVSTGVSDLANFDVVSLGEGLGDTLGGAASKAAGKAAGKALETTEGVAKGVKEATEKAAGAIKDMLPFGK
ncbi:MAG: hypothetical protein KJ706_10410 [Candidatus Omnitrophica bacterium]|nr:hypothetical protein [Candidatus Omnitrophota bacterium]MBU4590106.1 hypothetical protein [Candidatus Omnitrophota bacterium]